MNAGDTIAALATAPGRGGVAVVRMSGPEAWEMAGRVLRRPIGDAQAGRFFFSRFGEADSGLVLVFKGPH